MSSDKINYLFTSEAGIWKFQGQSILSSKDWPCLNCETSIEVRPRIFQGFCCFSSNAHRWNHWDFPRHLLFCLKWPLVVIELYQSICCFLSWTVSALRQIFLCGCCSIEVLWEDDFPKASTHDWRLKLMLQDN